MSPWRERPGGTEYHVKDLLRSLRLPRAVVVWPEGNAVGAAEVMEGEVEAPTFHRFPAGAGDAPPRPLAMEGALRRAVEVLGVTAAHVHHLLFWPLGVLRALEDAGVPYLFTHHDYGALCPNWNLYDFERQEPCACRQREGSCLAGYARLTGALRGLDVEDERRRHREAMDHALASASAHVFPSKAALAVFARQVGGGDPRRRVIEHGYDGRSTRPRRPPGPRLRLAFVGEVAYPIKGADRYLELLRRLGGQASLEWHVFGDTEPFGFTERLRTLDLGERLVLHGRYPRNALPDLLVEAGIDLCVLLPNWDETFSYVLSESLVAGVPALVSARGALVERIERAGAGTAVRSVEEAAAEVLALQADRARLAAWTERARAFVHRPIADSAADHRGLYEELGWLRDQPLEAWEAPRLLALLPTAGAARGRGPEGARAAAGRPLLDRIEQPLRRIAGSRPALARPLRAALGVARALPMFRAEGLAAPRSGWRSLAIAGWAPQALSLQALGPDPSMQLEVEPFDAAPVKALRFAMRHRFSPGDHAQLYWTHEEGEDFSEPKSAKVELGEGDGAWHTYRIELDSDRQPRRGAPGRAW